MSTETEHRVRFVHAQLAWMSAAALVLSVLDALTYERFFVLSFLGVLVVSAVTAPFDVRPRWRRRLWWILLVGMIVFVVIVGRRVYGGVPLKVMSV